MELYIEFIKSLNNYTKLFYKNLSFRYINNPKYLEFIYLKGLFLLKHIFLMLHINCVSNIAINALLEKAYIYFIEFLIQINNNCANFELTLKDAILFTYKKTIVSYKQTNINKNIIIKDFDNNLNILCNIFYIVNNLNNLNNVNFIDILAHDQTYIEEYIELIITNKLNNIKTLENKVLNIIAYNNGVEELNNKLLDLRANMEKTLDDASDASDNNITNINMLLDDFN